VPRTSVTGRCISGTPISWYRPALPVLRLESPHYPHLCPFNWVFNLLEQEDVTRGCKVLVAFRLILLWLLAHTSWFCLFSNHQLKYISVFCMTGLECCKHCLLYSVCHHEWLDVQGGSNMTGTNCDLFTHNQSRSYSNHLVLPRFHHWLDKGAPSIYITLHFVDPLVSNCANLSFFIVIWEGPSWFHLMPWNILIGSHISLYCIWQSNIVWCCNFSLSFATFKPNYFSFLRNC
jgi:hypothetical protein